MKNANILLFSVLLLNVFAEKINLDTLNNYSEFLNFGDKKINKLNKNNLENAIFKSKIDILGEVFKKNVDILKMHDKLDIVFLVDASSSVGSENFKSELKFVKKLLSDITVDYNHTRIAVITFSSTNEINVNVDEISQPSKDHNKCLLLNKQLSSIQYKGGDTFTLGAFQAAKDIFENSQRNNTRKALFLITDGYSNGGDPTPLAQELKEKHITIFTIGIRNGNYKELYALSSSPGEFYSYLLDSFEEFESLARRALHVDLKSGEYVPLGVSNPCDGLCEEGDCCDKNAMCSCGTTTGHYSCLCKLGYYGSGLKNSCLPCIDGTYSDGPNTCIPCPDINHRTTIPAIGIDSCKCKLGYEDTKDHKCKTLKCPKIQIPDHGYVVKKRECGNVVNSACGIRCEVGYSLVGNSIRLCQVNSSWSGKPPSCEVKVCMPLPTPKFGSMNCTHSDVDIESDGLSDMPVDTTCIFKCNKGKNLIGSQQRTCLPLSRWDGLRTLCKPIKCLKLAEIKFGKVEPSSCSIGKQEYGKQCKIVCNEGFEIKGPSERVCTGKHGTWDTKLEDTVCTDVTPPKLICPKNITTVAISGKKYGITSWSTPEVTDNSGLEISIWMKPVIKNITIFKFQIGTTAVKYFAQDGFQNKINCTFYVTVEDTEKPVIENCVDPPTFLTTDKTGANITWDEPNIFDNSQDVKITKSHNFGFFKVGTVMVTYNATDNSNNTNMCNMNITVEEAHCEILPDPIFGHSNCSTGSQGIQCVISCQEGYAIPLNQNIKDDDENSTSFFCNHTEPLWLNQEGLNFPECSVTQIPDITEKSGELSLKTDYDVCNNSDVNSELKNDISSSLTTNLCEKDCNLNVNFNCEDDLEKAEEETNIIKRDLSSFEVIPHKNKTKKYRKRVNVKFQVRGKYITEKNNSQIILSRGQNASIRLDKKTKFLCPDGFVPRKNRCVQCPRGTYHNITINRCQSCSIGYFNDHLGQTSCISCPLHFSTRKLRSKSATECREKCPPGTYSKRRTIKYHRNGQSSTIERPSLSPHCRSCGIGYFQSEYGKLHCMACPKGYTTTIYGSVNVNQCVPTSEEVCNSITNICNNGTCASINEYEYGCNCLDGYYGTYCEKKVSPCDSGPCFNSGTCESFNGAYSCKCPFGFTGKYCQDVQRTCNLSCLNNGVCVESEENDFICLCPDGFGGDLCEIWLKYCSENICENNSTCIEEKNYYKCICSRGFIGKRCSILPCDYRPCSSNTICVNIMEPNATRNSFKCVCPDGYTGKMCSEKIDFCEENSCQNNGKCISETYKFSCECSKLYYGRYCEHQKTTNYLLEFPKYDTNDYIKLSGFPQNISEITACLWMETIDSFNYGTLVSYATRKMDNSFTMTDYTGLILYVNNQYIVTDILLNDGFWHHICASWSNTNGSYNIYIDGELMRNGTDLARNTNIQGDGNLVIGQEQDILGGRFSQSESFMGKMTYIDIWSKVLSKEDILRHMNDCNKTQFGDLYAWPEIQDHVMGNIKIINSSFCQRCKEPKPLYNGLIDVVDNVAFYSCYVGYQLSNNAYQNGRKCNKISTWEGVYEPYCKKVYCGYPGYVRNAYALGKKYYYKDKVTYMCYEGYTLNGHNTISCRGDGKWFPENPRCIGMQCTAFAVPENGKINILSDLNTQEFEANSTKVEAGSQVEVTCNDNWNITGESFLTCLESGEWDVPVPTCTLSKNTTELKTLDCPTNLLPQPPLNGYIDLESLSAVENGSSNFVSYHCRTGFNLVGDNVTTCIIDGYWTEMNISCEAITCSKPKKLPQMQLKYKEENKDVYIFGNKITYECRRGYKLSGNDTIRCQDDGEWSNILGTCIKICQKPFIQDTTIVIGDSYDIGNSIIIKCKSGSEYTLVCNSKGTWEGQGDSSC